MLIPFELCSKQVCAKPRENEAIHYFAFHFPHLLFRSPGGMLDIAHLHSLSTEHLSVSPYVCSREYSEQKVNFLTRAECHLQKNESFFLCSPWWEQDTDVFISMFRMLSVSLSRPKFWGHPVRAVSLSVLHVPNSALELQSCWFP